MKLKTTPTHIAIIMDGNGRWAKKRGLPKITGHQQGVKAIENTIEGALDLGIKILTLYAFSTENWKRPELEVKALMKLLETHLEKRNKEDLRKKGVRFRAIGKMSGMPESIQIKMRKIEEETKENKNLLVNLALNYGSRMEIIEATKSIATLVLEKKLKPGDITEDVFAKHLYTSDIPDPDMLIRTSGEMRLSNFLLWQISYAELYVTDVLWPDFGKKELETAVNEYKKRDRRYGG
ncbi:MAG: isoprenyl transferase [Candidatus Omnitrophica bacterium]|nr:isoprenyl transferase [Candidatus Omnitrophota bacterium]